MWGVWFGSGAKFGVYMSEGGGSGGVGVVTIGAGAISPTWWWAEVWCIVVWGWFGSCLLHKGGIACCWAGGRAAVVDWAGKVGFLLLVIGLVWSGRVLG